MHTFPDKNILRKFPGPVHYLYKMPYCPNCGSPSVLPSEPRNILVRRLLAFIVGCECKECDYKFLVTKWHKLDPAGARENRWYPG